MRATLLALSAWLTACLPITVLAGPSAAQQRPARVSRSSEDNASSTEGALFLLLPVGARAVALGRAMTAVEGSESAFWNPAGLATLGKSRFLLVRGDHVAGQATAASLLLARPPVGTLGFSYFLLDVGDQELRDANGNSLGTISVRNHLGVASFAAHLWNHVNAGINLKVVQFRLSCRGICENQGTTATTYALDWGVQVTPSENLRFGAMMAHLGPKLQVLNAEQADPLPARARVAVAYNVVHGLLASPDLGGWILIELQDRLRDPGVRSLYLGSELTAGRGEALALRAGYVFGDLDQEQGARVGLGLTYERFQLSIAKSLVVSSLTGESEPVHVSFTIVL